MVFSSIIFLFVFLPMFLLCYFFFKKRNIRNIVLLIFSLMFYAYGEPIYLLLMILSIIINYIFGLLIDKYSKYKKILLILSIIFNLGLLFIFKYYDFFISNINNWFNLNISYLSLSLPIGISFYTFQVLTYIIDLYKGKVTVQKNIINLGCYISAFPQLIAGPIVRYETVSGEIINRNESIQDFSYGLKRFIIGLAKKVIISNEMAYVADTIYGGSIISAGFIGCIIAALCYTIQIYFDFSGYSDMAIGLGRMLGFHYDENFNYPYTATSITDFWRRWHISLSTFFKDYIYIPLGGNRCSKFNQIRNMLIVWLLTGLWHGASWNFILWGLYYFFILVIEKYILNKHLKHTPNVIKHIYTIILIVLGWIIFYHTDINTLTEVFKSILGFNGLGSIVYLKGLQIFKVRTIIIFIISLFGCTNIFKNKLNNFLLLILFIISIIFIVSSSYNPFIYFRF